MEPTFSPPLHMQRHQFVIDFVKRNKTQKVVDLGCSECSLLKKLKFHREIELLVGVDINGAKVKRKMHGLAPISSYYLQPTYDQLRIELYQGSVTQKDVRLRGFDLATCIELIEHLTLADVERFSEVVFGYMTPVAVIVSTPNSEFNPLFPGLTGFRHSDHKFEWTRAEFKSWALKVCLEYGYEVDFTGVGQAPPGQQERVGFCSQIGVFHRLGGRDSCNMLYGDDAEDMFSYTLLYSINYPSLRDQNILRRVLVSEVLYWAEKLKGRWLEQKRDYSFTLCQTEGGVSERRMEMENKQTAYATEACGAEMCGRGVAEDTERKDEELSWTNVQGQQELHRFVSVPLAVLWYRCPKVSALSGNLTNLKHILMEAPEVKLSQDGSAVLVQDQGFEEKGDCNDLEDSGYAEASQYSHSDEQEQAWDANV
ncbi:small RNA 2'-O-methyltransferase [Micropterus dolomieu]|uniref:small RNA 2'-O-methyltransferase n=1 Tax=Micropterus dolomieu TaxID=147949 RepID=UPI001E8D19BC|nr:small RNA 2'-O-methyltransferase [Micropterus dolomieu]XP_045904728.1 small RNA 2'-O-methyltransferase [Micropterus dolomieu]